VYSEPLGPIAGISVVASVSPVLVGVIVVVIVIVALVVLLALIKDAIEEKLGEEIPKYATELQRISTATAAFEAKLTAIGATADSANHRIGRLRRTMKALDKANYLRSVIQTLFGTFIGLVAAFSVDWVKAGGTLFPDGQRGRVVIVTGIGVVLVVLAPIAVFPFVDWLLGKLPGSDEG
jgi:ABC-type transport system involved in cytochrome bd biosynthesis fused ATPase/permease subunit